MEWVILIAEYHLQRLELLEKVIPMESEFCLFLIKGEKNGDK